MANNVKVMAMGRTGLGNWRMPAEWERHAATWLAWPHNRAHWPGKLLKEVRATYIRMIRAILPGECVHLLVDDQECAKTVLKSIPDKLVANLSFHKVSTNDIWIRDYGPIFIVNEIQRRKPEVGSWKEETEKEKKKLFLPASCFPRPAQKIAFTKWQFNAWGGKYRDLARDDRVVNRIDALRIMKRFDPGVVLEGGSIDVNGRGLCLTTEQCLLNPNRNPGLSRKEIEGRLRRYLGIRKILWLKGGITGDDTDGHIDDVARFTDPRTVVMAQETDRRSPHYAVMAENMEILKTFRDGKGRRLNVVPLPMPGYFQKKFPASYANFYISNHAVLVPIFGSPKDPLALRILRKLFPSKNVIGIDSRPLIRGLGSIHCVTQQQPF